MGFTIIVIFGVIAVLSIASWYSPKVKELLATAWAAVVALAIAVGAWAASWWTDTPVDIPPM